MYQITELSLGRRREIEAITFSGVSSFSTDTVQTLHNYEKAEE